MGRIGGSAPSQRLRRPGRASVAASFDAVGGKQGHLALESLRNGGSLLVYGRMSGEPYPLHKSLIMYRNLTISGFGVNAFLAKPPRAQTQRVLEDAARLIRSGQGTSGSATQYHLQEYAAAFESESAGGLFVLQH